MAAKLLSVFAALRGPLGGGDLRLGGGPLAPPDGGCCAMHRDGSYWANMTIVGALGDSGKLAWRALALLEIELENADKKEAK